MNNVSAASQPVIFNAPIVNQPPRVPQLSVKRSNRLPTEMQGTWYEVTQDSQGQRVLNRYELDAAGSYEMLQFSISAQNDVDLNSPIAQLSQIASAQQRTLAYQDGQFSLGKFQVVGQFEFRFLYGPRFFVSSTGSKSTISSIFHLRLATPAA